MKMGSFFSGSGGFELAGEHVGIHTVWESEIEPFPMMVTQVRFPDAKQLGDISRINGALLEPVDIVAGGSPCQNMSIAGNRTGLDGEQFAEKLLAAEKVAVVPGSAFGGAGKYFVRASYAASMKQLSEAVRRIAAFLGKTL